MSEKLTVTVDGPTPYQFATLQALNLPTPNGRSRHIYEGTVPTAVKARRRAANKTARKARRAAR